MHASISVTGSHLSPYEAQLLGDCEKIIEGGIKVFLEVGRALLTIRDGRLYRQTHKTFEDYCRQRWALGRSHAYRQIDCYKTFPVLEDSNVVPINERQMRPLLKLTLDKRRVAWDLAVLSSPSRQITTRSVEAAVNRLLTDHLPRPRRHFGEPMDFEGLRNEPINELGVVFLFGIISRRLGFRVESVQSGFPDCSAKRLVDQKRNRWEQVDIEFEYESRTFLKHGHDYSRCDLLVCWIHNWSECPIEVLVLKDEVRKLAARS